MIMSRHFMAIAAAMKQTCPPDCGEPHKVWVECCWALADTLADFNPRFDKDKFIEACQPPC